jgi:hypothetical protein
VVTKDSESTPVTPTSLQYDADTNTATLVFATVLADGNYTATVLAAGVQDTDGNSMSANATHYFFQLVGDANGDRVVDVTDLGILASNWQQTQKLFSDGDFNYNTSIDVGDLGILASHWQTSLSASAPAQSPAKSARMVRSAIRVSDQVLTA